MTAELITRSLTYKTSTTLSLLLSSRKTGAGLVIVAALAVTALFAPLIATNDPNTQALANSYRLPNFLDQTSGYLLGSDSLGRDIYSRAIYGARAALFVAVVGATFAGLIGVPIGLIAGYYRGRLDELLMRIVDIWMSLPPVVFSLALIAILGVGLQNVALAVIVVDWTRYARVIRSEVLNIREREYILAAKALGLRSARIIREEVVPNIVPLAIVLFTLEMSIALTVEVLLSFAGLGVKADTPSWGAMISEGLAYFRSNLWGVLPPLGAVVVAILGFNWLGDGLREKLDPRLTVVK